MDTVENERKIFRLNFDLVQCVLGLIVAVLLYKLFRTRKSLPPGPYGLPLVGYLPFLGDDPSKKFSELSKKYGSLFSVRLGKNLVVIMNDYDTMKLVLSNPNSLGRAPVFGFLKHMGFAEFSGEKWIEERRLSLQVLKEISVGSTQWETFIQEEVLRFADKVALHCNKPFDIAEILLPFMTNNILSLLVGKCLEESSRECAMVCEYSEIALSEGSTPSVMTQLPILRDLLKYLGQTDINQKEGLVNGFLNFLKSEINNRKNGTESGDHTDFINLYMEKLQQIDPSGMKRYSADTDLLGNLNTLFLGFVDTVYTTLNWLFRLMVKFPDVQKKVQHELDGFMSEGEKICFEKRKNVPYTVAVIMETMRYSSIVPMSTTRSALSDFEVKGYTIPKGTQMSANFKSIHFDPNYWEDPHQFKPERFLRDNGRTVESNPDGFVNFSFGRRNCPGERIAWIEIMNIFPVLIHRFSITLPEGEVPNFNVNPGLVEKLKPQNLIFSQRIKKFV